MQCDNQVSDKVSQIIKLKQENFRVEIRKSQLQDAFQLKRHKIILLPESRLKEPSAQNDMVPDQ